MTPIKTVDADAQTKRQALAAGVSMGMVFLGIGALLGSRLLGIKGWWIGIFALGVAIVAGFTVYRGALAIAVNAADAISAFVYPTGKSSPYEQSFSGHDALAAKGDIAGAIAAYDATIAEEPENLRAKRQAAELHSRDGNPIRAAELFSEIRRAPEVSSSDELYATQRLIDLYLGPLGDDGRALVELRRIVERFPGTNEAAGARSAIERIKRERA